MVSPQNLKCSKQRKKALKIAFQSQNGRSDRVRTCGIDVPNAKMPIFSLLYKAFRGFCVQNQCFRVLLEALFPRSPNLQMVKTVVKPVSMGYGCYQEIENPTPHKFFFCHYYTILRRNSQQAFPNTQNLQCSSQRKRPTKKLDLFSKKVWTFVPFCGIVVC